MAKKRKQRSSTPQERAARDERKRARREARKQEEATQRRRQRARRQIRTWGLLAAAVVAVGGLVFVLTRPDPEVEGVEKPSSQGADHVAEGQPIDYETAAPTSGPHYGSQVAPCGDFTEPLPLPPIVHALEHGAVVLWYRPDVESDARPALTDLLDDYDSHVIVAPNPDIEEPVVATAWNRRMRFQDVDDPKLAEFVDTYRERGPEKVGCPT